MNASTPFLAGLRPKASITLLAELMAGKQAVLSLAVAGFVLHPDAGLAQSVAEALAASTRQMEIITDLLVDLPSVEKNPAAVARAHADLVESELQYQWFEAGEALEDMLCSIKGSKQRVAKLLKTYLPERRLFWARQCAISALAIRGNGKTCHSPWKQLALVGREIGSDLPLDQIPLMKQIAGVSVRAFEAQL